MTRAGDADFGAYLATVQERDVDLLLMEEFHVSPAFATWFAARAGVDGAAFEAAWHSVTDADGETDLLLRVVTPDGRVGLLIENKVAAPQGDRQAERYHLRAARAQHAGRFDRYVTCIAAPDVYLAALADDTSFQARVGYEAIVGWYEEQGGRRADWRAAVMREAIAQGRRGYTMVVNAAVTRFHRDFHAHLQRHEPQLVMRPPTPKGGQSSWIRFKAVGFPPNREFALKLDQSVMELGFYRHHVDELRALDVDWPTDAILKQTGKDGAGKTAAVQLVVPPLDKARPLEEQGEALAAALAAAHRLRPFATLLTGSAAGGGDASRAP